MPRIALFGLRYTPDGRVRGGTKRPVHYFDSARSAASALCVSIDSVAECCRANKNDLDVEFGLVRLDGTPYFCCDMPLGDHYQVRICSKQDKTVKAESAFFRVVDPVTSNSESTYRVDGGIATSLDNKVNTMIKIAVDMYKIVDRFEYNLEVSILYGISVFNDQPFTPPPAPSRS